MSYFLAAFFVSFERFWFFDILDISLALFSMSLMFFCVYAYNSFVDLSDEKKYKKINMFKNQGISRSRVSLYFIVIFIFSVYLSYRVSVYHFVLMSVIGIVGFMYSSRWIRLKGGGAYVKSLSIVFSYILLFFYFAFLFSENFSKIIIFALYFGSLSLCGTIFQDIRDRSTDAVNNVKTFAVLYTDRELASVFDAITLIVYSSFFVLVSVGVIHSLYVLMLLVAPLRMRFTKYLRIGKYKTGGKASLYSYMFSVLILFVIWLLITVY